MIEDHRPRMVGTLAGVVANILGNGSNCGGPEEGSGLAPTVAVASGICVAVGSTVGASVGCGIRVCNAVEVPVGDAVADGVAYVVGQE